LPVYFDLFAMWQEKGRRPESAMGTVRAAPSPFDNSGSNEPGGVKGFDTNFASEVAHFLKMAHPA
jgi:hypothetical protein